MPMKIAFAVAIAVALCSAFVYGQAPRQLQAERFTILNTGNQYSSAWKLDAVSGKLSYCFIVGPAEPREAAPTHILCVDQR